MSKTYTLLLLFLIIYLPLLSQDEFSIESEFLQGNDHFSNRYIIPIDNKPNYLYLKLKKGHNPSFIYDIAPSVKIISLVDKMKFNSHNKLRDAKLSLDQNPRNNLDIKRNILLNSLADIYLVEIENPKEFNYNKINEIRKSEKVQYIETPQKRYFDNTTVDAPDPLLSEQDYFAAIGMDPYDNNLPDASDILIAIVDSGTDTEHEDLSDNIYINLGEIPDNGLDDDDNGYIDDISGWDFVGDITREQADDGIFLPDNDPKPNHSSNRHGTHVAGCASAVNFNDTGVASPGRGAKLLPIKTAADNMDELYGLYFGYEGILYSSYMGADIINCSWGGSGFSQFEYDIIKAVTEAGSIVISSAGNDRWNNDLGLSYPTVFPEVIAVGASVLDESPANFSNFGLNVDVFAPGTNILATYPNNTYGQSSGTSMAGPIVSGMAATVLAKFPTTTKDELRSRLRYSAKSFTDFDFGDEYAGVAQIDSILIDDPKPSLGMIKTYQEGYVEDNLLFSIYPVFNSINNLNIELIPTEDIFEIAENTINYTLLSDTVPLDIEFSFSETNPWYRGRAALGIYGSYDEGNSIDSYGFSFVTDSNGSIHQFMGYPIDLFDVAWRESKDLGFTDVDNDEVVWFSGFDTRNREGIIFNPVKDIAYRFENFYVTSTHQYQDGRILIAASNNGELIYSDDGFETQEVIDLSSETSNIQGMVVYEADSRIVVIGRPAEGEQDLVILVSTDNGATFVRNPFSLEIATTQGIFAESIVSNGDYIAMADTRGRLIYSLDKGTNWDFLDLPERYSHKMAMSEKGLIAVLASDDRRYFDIPSLYEIDINTIDQNNPEWIVTPSEELPQDVFDYIIQFTMPAGFDYRTNAATGDELLYMVGNEGQVYKRSNNGNRDFEIVKSVRGRDYQAALISPFGENENWTSIYMASVFANRLVVPENTPSQAFTLGNTNIPYDQIEPNVYFTTLVDSIDIGQELIIDIPFHVLPNSDDVFVSLLSQPFSNEITVDYSIGDWYSRGQRDTTHISFIPKDSELLVEEIRYKIGENVYVIRMFLKGIDPAGIKYVQYHESSTDPYLAGSSIVIPNNVETTLYDIKGNAISVSRSKFNMEGFAKGIYILSNKNGNYKISW